MPRRSLVGSVMGLVCLWLTAGADESPRAESPANISFERSIAPLLEAKCVACHRADLARGTLDLSTRAGLLRGGELGAGVVPGKPEESPVYTRSIAEAGQRPEMPEKGDPLTETEAAMLRDWIAAGAEWPEGLVLKERAKADETFWSFQPIVAVDPPSPSDGPTNWRTHPIDRFLLAALVPKGLTPNGPAEPRVFLRRATYDMLGLPPTPEEVAAFESDCAAEWARPETPRDQLPPAAVERVLDRLLASPHYGEHWGRHWLDVIRFGESRGYERNEIITNLWPFRDYIIRSFNDDKPFDRLILEHLAGDVIGRDQPEVEVGSAFLVAGPYDDVGNQDPVAAARIRSDQMDEMIRATSEAFLGLTLGCARCHDHKFDPLLQKDYYALYATFAGTVHGPREVASAEARRTREARLAPLQQARAQRDAERQAHEADLASRIAARKDELSQAWVRPPASRYLTEETFEPHEAKHVRLIVENTDVAGPPRHYRIDEFELWTDEPEPRNVALASLGAMATGASRDAKDFAGAYGAELTIDGQFGERWIAEGPELVITLARPERIRRVVFSSDRPRGLTENHPLTVFVGDYRIETSADGETWRTIASSSDRQPASEPCRQARWKRLVTTEADRTRAAELQTELTRLDAALAQIPPLPVWWVGTHRPVPEGQTLFRGGDPQRPGDPVVPASLHVLRGLPSAYAMESGADEGARRVALATWLTSADHPLTARVLANRVWQYHFGVGLVETASDFGYMGSRPSHPELLDWLANELRQGGWRLKPLHRRIMRSQAYQQSGAWREAAARVDADSRLLWRFPPRRLAAEELRDTLLSLAGRLDRTMGGPGFRLYEYQQDNVATYVPLDLHGPETYRRAVYHHNARSARVDLLSDFDCPDPAFAEPRRAATTSPLQALTMLNHGFALDMAQAWAERLSREANTVPEQVRRAFAMALARPADDAELAAAIGLIETHGLRAFCRALLNANELLTVH